MLAFMPDEIINSVIEKGLTRFTDNTIVEKKHLIEELKNIRMRGYSVDNMEHEYGIKCVGMPIRNNKGEVIAGLSISGPSLRFDEKNIMDLSNRLKQSIVAIEERL